MIFIALGAALFLTSQANYLLFHVLVEIFSVVIAFSVFILAWNAQKFLENDYLLFTGIAFLFIAGLDLIHTFSYQGMGVFPGQTANVATQLWVSARYLQALTLVAAPFMLNRRINVRLIIVLFAAVTAVILLSIFHWHAFPVAFVPDQGLTPFKVISEYVIIALLMLSGALLVQNRRFFDPLVLRFLIGFLVACVAAELAFTAYVSVFAPANALGHLFKVLAFYFLYKAILETGFVKPYNFMFRNLMLREEELKRANQDLELELHTRKRVEEALRKSEARLRRLADSNIIGVMFSNRDGRIREANGYLLDLVGYRRADLQTGQLCWIDLTPPEYTQADWQAISETMERGACTPYEKEFLRKDGSRVPILTGYARIEDSDDFICFVLDLTQRKQAEASLANYALRLEQSNQQLEDFAFVASHDLQEPLRKIQTFGGRLKELVGDKITTEEQDYLQRMVTAAARMRNMINDLLALSRVTTQGQPFSRVSLEEIAREVLADLEVQVEKTGGRVELGALPVIDADPAQIRQLMQNLISNGLKFHRPDVPPVLHITSETVHNNGSPLARVEIKDNGIGFELEYAERIFQPFQRLHGRNKYEGNGIGLTICRKIVERHNGQITVSSQPEVGSVFSILLPYTQQDGVIHEIQDATVDHPHR
ncbi:MAG TPA: MASE3 domain-containing protein [Anaerolineaceae bacterium]|nr:MASE3 domain-containing protein [Anaerolineaceae bacterium]